MSSTLAEPNATEARSRRLASRLPGAFWFAIWSIEIVALATWAFLDPRGVVTMWEMLVVSSVTAALLGLGSLVLAVEEEDRIRQITTSVRELNVEIEDRLAVMRSRIASLNDVSTTHAHD